MLVEEAVDGGLEVGDRAKHAALQSASLIELRAAYMPDAAWAVSVRPPKLIPKEGSPPVLTSPNPLSTSWDYQEFRVWSERLNIFRPLPA